MAETNGSAKFMLWFASILGVIEALCIFVVRCFLFKNRKHSSVDNHWNIFVGQTNILGLPTQQCHPRLPFFLQGKG